MVFQERHNNGRLDLEAVETALRSALHQAGASALTQLLRYDPPDADHRAIPCPCGYSAHYKELRSKTVLDRAGPGGTEAPLLRVRPLLERPVPGDLIVADHRLTPNWVSPVWNPRLA